MTIAMARQLFVALPLLDGSYSASDTARAESGRETSGPGAQIDIQTHEGALQLSVKLVRRQNYGRPSAEKLACCGRAVGLAGGRVRWP
jgi:hypothetical protein